MKLLKALGKALLATIAFIIYLFILGVALAGFQSVLGETMGTAALLAISLFMGIVAGEMIRPN